MKLSKLTIAVAALGLTLSAMTSDAQDSFKVVVNAKNDVSEMTRDEVSNCFLKKQARWAGKGSVAPIDLPADSPVRAAFSKAILNKDVQSVKQYWNALIFSGRGVPPIEKSSDAGVLAFVSSNEGAIGYVAASATVPAGVKVLKLK